MDLMLYEAFRVNVKRSMMVMSKAINGDKKSGPYPLFSIKVVLENNKVRQWLVRKKAVI
jgi:dynein heavy chain